MVSISILYCLSVYSQIPVQVFGGNKAIEYNFIWFKDFEPGSKVSLFNFTFFSVNYADADLNSSEIYQTATYKFNSSWGIATGGRYSEGEFLPLAAISYERNLKNIYIRLRINWYKHVPEKRQKVKGHDLDIESENQ